jgi:hypothetical protein
MTELIPNAQQAQENRLLAFANVFKGYMGVMPIVTAALAPLLTAINVIPTYETQRKPLATMAGMLGFLLLSWVFYVRRTIALGSITRGFRWFYNICPLLLILGSVACYVTYANTLDTSLAALQSANPTVPRAHILSTWGLDQTIPHSVPLQLLYLGMFLCAEAAFVMMALREYAIDVLRISEYNWMFGAQNGPPPPASSTSTPAAPAS